MKKLTHKEKQYLISLALQAIKSGLKLSSDSCPLAEEIPFTVFKNKGASFVTLYVAGRLRGCIGHIEAVQPLYQDVYDNAQAAAFSDPRFPAVEASELERLKIEISLLSALKPVKADTPEQKLAQIKPRIHGVVLRAQGRSATFLPQVWDDLPDKIQFMESLCRKAWLSVDAWREPDAKLFIYTVDSCSNH